MVDLEDRLAVFAISALWAMDRHRHPHRTIHDRAGRPATASKDAALVEVWKAWHREHAGNKTDFARFLYARLGVQAGASPTAIRRHLNRAILQLRQ